MWHVGSINKFSDQGLSPGSLHWEHAHLATGPPGKSLSFLKNYLKRQKNGKRKPVLKRYLTLNKEPGVDKRTAGNLRVCRMDICILHHRGIFKTNINLNLSRRYHFYLLLLFRVTWGFITPLPLSPVIFILKVIIGMQPCCLCLETMEAQLEVQNYIAPGCLMGMPDSLSTAMSYGVPLQTHPSVLPATVG